MSMEPFEWVNVKDLLESTGARNLTRSGNEFTFSCFSGNHSHGDATPSAGMNATTTLWRCRSPNCGLKGNAVDYLAELRGFTKSEALRLLQEKYGGPEISSEPGELEMYVQRIRESHNRPEEERIAPSEQWVDYFAHNLESTASDEALNYLIGRGISPSSLAEWQLGYDPRSDRVTIPIRDQDGKLVGFKARAISSEQFPKYLILGHQLEQEFWSYDFNTYKKSDYVFGADHHRHIKSVVICEGELNAIALHQMGIHGVAVAGSEFSEKQRQIIVSLYDSATIYFDDDLAGRAGVEKVAEALSPDMPVKVVQHQLGDAAEALEADSSFGPYDAREWIVEAIPYCLVPFT